MYVDLVFCEEFHNSCVGSKTFVDPLGFSAYVIVLSVHRDSFFPSFISYAFLFHFLFLLHWLGLSRMLNRNGKRKRRHLCLVPNIIAKVVSLLSLSMMLFIVGFFGLFFVLVFLVSALYQDKEVLFLLRKKGCQILSNVFLTSTYMIMWFLFQSINLVDSIDQFTNVHQPCILRTNPS